MNEKIFANAIISGDPELEPENTLDSPLSLRGSDPFRYGHDFLESADVTVGDDNLDAILSITDQDRDSEERAMYIYRRRRALRKLATVPLDQLLPMLKEAEAIEGPIRYDLYRDRIALMPKSRASRIAASIESDPRFNV